MIFQQNAMGYCKGAMVTVTIVRVTKDLSMAKVYLSIFGGKDNEDSYKRLLKKRLKLEVNWPKL